MPKRAEIWSTSILLFIGVFALAYAINFEVPGQVTTKGLFILAVGVTSIVLGITTLFVVLFLKWRDRKWQGGGR
jgi:ABC-type spermidine/putrescine transport system permease subunit II